MSDKFLYSPWRLDYIQSEKPEDCVLCRFRQPGRDRENLIVHRDENFYVMLNRYPYNNGHIMLVPYLHLKSLGELPPATMEELGQMLQLCEKALNQAYACEGMNIGINLGRAAGAGIAEHLHIHLVPRWSGDCNFMSAVGGKRVIPEAFEVSFERLSRAFSSLKEPAQ